MKGNELLGLLTNADGCPVAVEVFAGNTADPATLSSVIAELRERFGLKRIVLAGDLLKRGLALMTKVRKNMKALPLTPTDKLLLNARNMVETIIGHIKAFSSLNLPKHRAPLNAFRHLLAALSAYSTQAHQTKRLLLSAPLAASIKTRYRG